MPPAHPTPPYRGGVCPRLRHLSKCAYILVSTVVSRMSTTLYLQCHPQSLKCYLVSSVTTAVSRFLTRVSGVLTIFPRLLGSTSFSNGVPR